MVLATVVRAPYERFRATSVFEWVGFAVDRPYLTIRRVLGIRAQLRYRSLARSIVANFQAVVDIPV